MTRQVDTERQKVAKTDLLQLAEENATPYLLDNNAFEEFVERIREEIATINPDVSTEENREVIRSAAYRISRCKNTIDADGKRMTAEARKHIEIVNDSRRHVWATLETLQKEVRRPLTDWEAAEQVRQEARAEIQRQLTEITLNPAPTDSIVEDVESRLKYVQSIDLDDIFDENGIPQAKELKASAISALEGAREKLLREEADRAELERLRKEEAEREARERAEAEAEAERQRIAEAEQRAREEERRLAAERERELEALAQQQEEEAKAEARRREEESQQKIREAEERAQREREEAAAAERQKQKEAEDRARDEAYRKRVFADIAQDLIAIAPRLKRTEARFIAEAMAEGEIRHTRIQF